MTGAAHLRLIGIEKAFGVKMDTLLRMQARYDDYHMRQQEKLIRVRKFVPA